MVEVIKRSQFVTTHEHLEPHNTSPYRWQIFKIVYFQVQNSVRKRGMPRGALHFLNLYTI